MTAGSLKILGPYAITKQDVRVPRSGPIRAIRTRDNEGDPLYEDDSLYGIAWLTVQARNVARHILQQVIQIFFFEVVCKLAIALLEKLLEQSNLIHSGIRPRCS